MCFSFFKRQGIATGNSLVEDEGGRGGRGHSRSAAESPCDLRAARRPRPRARVLDAETERRELDGVEVPDGWMGLDIGAAHGGRLRRGDRGGRDRVLERADGRLRARAVRRRHPRGRRGGRRGAGDDRGRRRRLGRRARTSSASPIESTGSRPAAAPRWSCSRGASCPGWRRCSTPGSGVMVERCRCLRKPICAANWKMHKTRRRRPRRSSTRSCRAHRAARRSATS